MVFKNPVKPVTIEIEPRGAPCGFSKSRHKKMSKKDQVTKITEEDFSNIGYGSSIPSETVLARMIRVFKDRFDRGINESFHTSEIDTTPLTRSEIELKSKLRNSYCTPSEIRNLLDYKGGGEDDIHQAESENGKSS